MSVRLLWVLLLVPLPLLALPVEQVPRPRPGHWSVDVTGTLSPEVLARVDRLGEQVVEQGVGQLAVVVIDSTDGELPRPYATRLFNRWGIGHAERDDGVLLLVALGDRKAEIILGDGVDTAEGREASERVMQDEVVPRFRAGDPDAAVLAGAQGLAELLGAEGVGERPAGPPGAGVPQWLYLTGGAGGLALLAGGGRAAWRRRTRRCRHCGQDRRRLDEARDDVHLTAGQRTEERLGSVDYDVWWCDGCEDALVLHYASLLSSFRRCPACLHRTARTRSTTLVPATYDSGGLVEVHELCKHCNHHTSRLRNTPRKTRPSSSHSSSWGSSGGSSFGGGSSSGGGSSGSW